MSAAHRVGGLLCLGARMFGAVALGLVALAVLLALVISAAAHRCAPSWPPEAVIVPLGRVPPDACVAFYGPGPCWEHGSTIMGSTEAVAGPPPLSWHGRVEAPAAPGRAR